ncbi:sialate O-acetylesterase [Paenibacillus eucommiae]|uniref:Sialate O-acetylesterase n=1 Tax=Paenibacillus eucommiae TaxID=1355755 RepID=A0ABS4J0K0_9BACL|nr:sialate O-acetylesterase [Paenibacillus eucommiae]MBP1993362.1 sialate O-acetylesterase [Paenibacillus eucommiae]
MEYGLKLSEQVRHRVFQRDERNKATIEVSVHLMNRVTGRLEGRISTGPWRIIGHVEQPIFTAVIEDVPVGEHEIQLRVVADENNVVAEGAIGPVYVGDLWLLAGQSNMQGCGRLIDVEEPQAGVSCFYMGDRWDQAEEPLAWLMESPDPIHWMHSPEGMDVTEEKRQEYIAEDRREKDRGTGPGLPFGKMLLSHTGIPVGLLMVAHGGTSMSQWDAALAGEGGRSLYGSMLRVIQAVGGKVRGCLWYQGESDADDELSKLYYDRMIEWVASLRKDLSDPHLPIIYAQIAAVNNWVSEAAWNRIQDDQLRLEKVLGNAAVIPTIDSLLADVIHPDTHSLRNIGYRMAWAALRLVHGLAPVQSGPRLNEFHWNEDRTELVLEFAGINGRLKPVKRAFSFQVTCDDQRLPLESYVDEFGQRIIIRLEQPAPSSCLLWHGRGFNPVVNVQDEQGIPLPVFGPVSV